MSEKPHQPDWGPRRRKFRSGKQSYNRSTGRALPRTDRWGATETRRRRRRTGDVEIEDRTRWWERSD